MSIPGASDVYNLEVDRQKLDYCTLSETYNYEKAFLFGMFCVNSNINIRTRQRFSKNA